MKKTSLLLKKIVNGFRIRISGWICLSEINNNNNNNNNNNKQTNTTEQTSNKALIN